MRITPFTALAPHIRGAGPADHLDPHRRRRASRPAASQITPENSRCVDAAAVDRGPAACWRRRPLKPRAETAHLLTSIRATSRPGAIRSSVGDGRHPRSWRNVVLGDDEDRRGDVRGALFLPRGRCDLDVIRSSIDSCVRSGGRFCAKLSDGVARSAHSISSSNLFSVPWNACIAFIASR